MFISIKSLLYVQAVTTPAMSVSHIMLEANKKYILVSILVHGKVNVLHLLCFFCIITHGPKSMEYPILMISFALLVASLISHQFLCARKNIWSLNLNSCTFTDRILQT